MGEKASAARSQPYYLDVTHPQANKGAVVATLSKLLNIPPAQIATIGDMPNDVLMFRKSGFSIAMGNASDEVKAAGERGDRQQRERRLRQSGAEVRSALGRRMTRTSEAKLEILADPDALARRVADWLLAAAKGKDGVFAVALSGGSTPRRLYERLAGPPYRDAFPWSPHALVLGRRALRAAR